MPATESVKEKFNARTAKYPLGSSTDPRTLSRDYQIRGYPEEADARVALYTHLTDNSLLTLESTPLKGLSLKEDQGDGDWVFTADWELRNANQNSGGGGGGGEVYEFSFDAGTSSFKQTKAYAQTAYSDNEFDHPAATFEGAIDGAIGVTADGAEGVEVAKPTWTEEITLFITDAQMTVDLRGELFKLVGKVNNDAFIYFQPGECRFDGVRGSRQNGENWRLALRFTGQANETLPIANGFPAISKKGWQYVWTFDRKTVLTIGSGTNADHTVVQIPKYKFLADVYETTSFALLTTLINTIPPVP